MKLLSTFYLFLSISISGVFAQNETTSIIAIANPEVAIDESHQPTETLPDVQEHSNKTNNEAVPDFYRHQKRLPAFYSGYTIELIQSERPLKRSYPLFKFFGNVYFDKLSEGGYSYFIKVDFSSKKAVKKFLKDVILHNAPDAKVVTYRKGKRK